MYIMYVYIYIETDEDSVLATTFTVVITLVTAVGGNVFDGTQPR